MSENGCPFCRPDAGAVFHAGRLVLGIWDGFPASPGHALIITKRHAETWADATAEEQAEVVFAIEHARRAIEATHRPDGYNLGVNIGEAAGQTVPHVHLHVIPRYRGDVPDPRGGVRHVLPATANYLAPGTASEPETDKPSLTNTLVKGEETDPLLPHLYGCLDSSEAADLAVAFIQSSGFSLLEQHLEDFLSRGGRFRLVTGDYLDVTEPNALLRLLDLQQAYPDAVTLRMFESAGRSFHPKAFIFRGPGGEGAAYVGSSNLTRTALQEGLEWNYRIVPASDAAGFHTVERGFEELWQHPRVRTLDAGWVEAYRLRRSPAERPAIVEVPDEPPPPAPEPHVVQLEALEALSLTRAEGNRAGLVVLATGLGKTWLSAFDAQAFGARRVLFVAHREEILRQAMATYRRIWPEATLGLYTGEEKTVDADVLFASVQTMGRARHLERFDSGAFDYIVVDEFHHAAASTYRRLINHFTPGFLLGLTATPERTDGGDLLALCGENLVYVCDVRRGIELQLLSPFAYFGVPDEVDYSNIPWRSSRFDEEALTTALATQARAANAFEQYQMRAGTRTLAFCCSTRHADFMADYFRGRGVEAVAVHSGENSAPRATSLKQLGQGEIAVVFAVDMFNEGVDLPNVDTVMMLRPTESRLLWQQQFGRGLRVAPDKDCLTVIDYIGNHRTFLLKPQTLFSLGTGVSEVAAVLDQLEKGEADLPPGCAVTYDLRAIEILRALVPSRPTAEALRWWYEDFRQRTGSRPTALEAFHEGYNPRSLRQSHGSWLGFVRNMGDFSADQLKTLENTARASFLDTLETTQMTRSYKMLVLLAMLNADRFPGEIDVDGLLHGIRRLVDRSALLQNDLSVDPGDDQALRALLEKNPIAAWTEGKGTPGGPYFTYEEGVFRSAVPVEDASRDHVQELTRELVEWRLSEYLSRAGLGEISRANSEIVSKVSHAGGRPIIFIDRETHPELPQGWTPLDIQGERYEANFVKVAVNVIRRAGSDANELPTLMRGWFGDDAGLPGTAHQVMFTSAEDGWGLRPVLRSQGRSDIEIGHAYYREEIPPLFGLKFVNSTWNQGFVPTGQNIFLLITLEKEGQPVEHQYEDRFLSREILQWQSQNRTSQSGKHGQMIREHLERGIAVHVFCRRRSKQATRAAPFYYCGEVTFVDWEGEKPITVQWRLIEPLVGSLAERLGLRFEA